MDSGFQVLDSGFYRCRFRIPKHKIFQILVSGLPLIFALGFLGMTSITDFAIEGHVCECMSVYSYFLRTFDNYEKCIAAN